MTQIGRINKLTVTRVRNYGAHLDGGETGDILLPKKYVPENCQQGDIIEVFVFAEGGKRLRATTKKPFATVGQFAKLRVKANSSSGSFMDWGLQKDLLVPKREQQARMEQGKSYIVYVFLDEKSHRITASAKLDKFLDQQPPDYPEGAAVDLLICSKTDLGYKAIVNNAHWGMIYKNEIFTDLHVGQQLQGYIKKIRDDRKIDLRLQQSGYEKVDEISRSVLKIIEKHGGSLAVTDNTPPEEIYSRFGISKKTFKKAIGALYKKRRITLDNNGIKVVAQQKKQEGAGRKKHR